MSKIGSQDPKLQYDTDVRGNKSYEKPISGAPQVKKNISSYRSHLKLTAHDVGDTLKLMQKN